MMTTIEKFNRFMSRLTAFIVILFCLPFLVAFSVIVSAEEANYQ